MNENIVKIGGSTPYLENIINDDSTIANEVVCDEAKFYICRRKAEINQIKKKAETKISRFIENNMYHSTTYGLMLEDILDKTLNKDLVFAQLVKVIDLIGEVEQKILQTLKINQTIENASLPEFNVPNGIEKRIFVNPDLLCELVNNMIKYYNRLSFDSFTKLEKKISPLNCIQLEPINFNKYVGGVLLNKSKTYLLQSMDKLFCHELIVAEYVKKIEQYWCKVLNKIYELYNNFLHLVNQ